MVVDWSNQLLRSLLFAPGNQPRKVAKVASFGADAIVLDLEDAVAVGEKEGARAPVRAALPTYRDTVVMVRVNALSTGLGLADLDAVVCPALDAVLVPKVDDPAILQKVDRHLATLEARAGIPVGTIRLLPTVETALGILRVDDIARRAPGRVHTLIFGLADFTTDLGVDLTRDATELLYARSRVAVACRATGLAPPIDGPYLIDLHDHDGLIADSQRGRQLGFQGRVVIYPPQVEPTNIAYSFVPDEEVAAAREIIQAFEAAEAAGSAAIRIAGTFVDYPVYRRALHKLRLHERVEGKNRESGSHG
ncbi:MAG: HpcH/HpaI aldolase/citrate lyase family protein, partial [Chloroflexota bacterium]